MVYRTENVNFETLHIASRKLLDASDDGFRHSKLMIVKLYTDFLGTRLAPCSGTGSRSLQKLVRELRDLEAEQNVIVAELGIRGEDTASKAEWPTDAEVVDSLLAAPPSFWDAYNLQATKLRVAVEELDV